VVARAAVPSLRFSRFPPMRTPSLILVTGLAVFVSLAFGCARKAPPPAAAGPRPVAIITTRSEDVPAINRHLGRVAAFSSIEVRARVQGLVEKVAFTEGAMVRRGDLLFLIEPDLYAGLVAEARAQLARAEAEATRANGLEQRLARLVANDAVSRQDYDNSAAAARQADASVLAARAALSRAELDLAHTRVVATEDGRIGRSLVHQGALVGRDGPTHLATIDRIDPVYLNFTIADLDALALRRAIEGGSIQSGETRGEVRVFLPDGSPYGTPGQVDFAERQVNPDTGTITLRALVPNPLTELLPGMFVRAELNVGTRSGIILLPQHAVYKTPTGHIAWVAAEGKAQRRDLVMGEWSGDRWIVERGLGVGEDVIVDGVTGLVPGAPVQALRSVAPLVTVAPAAPAAN
jgi:membrane fusion protein, multidrug efflux system